MKLIIIIFFLFNTDIGFARSFKINAKDWAEKVLADYSYEFDIDNPLIKIVGIEDIKSSGTVDFMFLDYETFNKLGIFYYIPPNNARLNLQINVHQPKIEKSYIKKTRAAKKLDKDILLNIFKYTGADLIIYKEKKWKVFQYFRGIVDEIFSTDGPTDTNPKKLYRWLIKNLHFEGLVLAVKKKSVLIITSKKYLNRNSQALIIESSAKTYNIPSVASEGSALLQRSSVNPYKKFGVFDIIITQKDKILPFSKLKLTNTKNK